MSGWIDTEWAVQSAAFKRSILERPHDETNWQVYADWLEEQGDIRAELIRIRWQMHRQTPPSQLAGLIRQEFALASEHEQRWLQTDWAKQFHFSWNNRHADVRDGIAATFRGDELEPLSWFTALTSLRLAGTSINDESMVHIAFMRNLSMLTLNHTSISDVGLGFISRCSSLSRLSLAHTNVTDAGMEHVAKLRLLCELNLRGTTVTDEGIVKLRSQHVLRIVDTEPRSPDSRPGGASDQNEIWARPEGISISEMLDAARALDGDRDPRGLRIRYGEDAPPQRIVPSGMTVAEILSAARSHAPRQT